MFSKFFIERPIFAIVVSLIICLAGGIAMTQLPVEQYPNMSPVQITVTAQYPGADAKTVADSVAAPLENQINGIDNMLYMTSSSSSSGQLELTVYFDIDTDPDIAQVQVQNRVNQATPQLPSEVTQNGVDVAKQSSSMLCECLCAGRHQARAGRGTGVCYGIGRSGHAHLAESGPDGVFPGDDY